MRKNALGLGLLVWCMGCSDGTDDVVCTAELRASVRLTVLDAAGNAAPDATVSYTVEGGASQPCTLVGEGFTCGLEEDGRFVITAVRDSERGEARTRVRADVCHVDPEDVTLTLEPSS
jgi:hypothetical protein